MLCTRRYLGILILDWNLAIDMFNIFKLIFRSYNGEKCLFYYQRIYYLYGSFISEFKEI